MTTTGTPIWAREAALPIWKPLDSSRREEIVIVGAGLAGLGLARELRALGKDPLVVDARGPGAGASGRNAGFVLRTHVTDYPNLRARIGSSLARELLSVAAENHARIRACIGASVDTHRLSGSLMLASGPAEAERLDEARRALDSDGVLVREVRVPPTLAGFDAALAVDDDGEVHPGRLLAALADGTRGAIFDVRSVHRSSVSDGRHVIEAEHVVLATNASLSALVPALARVVTPQRAQMLATEPLPRALDTPCYAGLGFDYFRQRDDGRVLLGGQRHRFLEAEQTSVETTSPEVQSALESYLAQHLPFARAARIEARWSGIMAFTPDGLPLAGRLAIPSAPWVLGGWTGHGLGLSLAIAARLARVIAGAAAPDAALSALDPSRFSAIFAHE